MTPEDIPALPTAADRAREAVRYITYAEGRITTARRLRDTAVRDMYDAGLSQPAIVRAAGMSLATVRLILARSR